MAKLSANAAVQVDSEDIPKAGTLKNDRASFSEPGASELRLAKESLSKLEAELAAAKIIAEQLSLAYSRHLVLTVPPTSGLLFHTFVARLCIIFPCSKVS